MPRPLSPDRLTDKEANEFRATIRVSRDRNSLTNADIAEHLGVKQSLVENALKSERPLLARGASKLLRAMLELCNDAPWQLLTADWYVSYRESLIGPRILVPTDQISALANYLLRELKQKPGIRKSTLTMIVRTFEHALRRDGPQMVESWKRKTMASFSLAAFERKHSSKNCKKSSIDPGASVELQRFWESLQFIEISSIGEK